MTEYTTFLMQHWLLTSGFIAILLLLIGNELIGRARSARQCSPQQLVQMMNHDEATLIDVRDKDEYRTAKIIGSKNIPAQDLLQKIDTLDKVKAMVLICNNAQQSAKQAQVLKEKGFNVYYLAGGLTAWRNENLPLAK